MTLKSASCGVLEAFPNLKFSQLSKIFNVQAFKKKTCVNIYRVSVYVYLSFFHQCVYTHIRYL